MSAPARQRGPGPLVIIGGHEDRDPAGRRTILAAIAERLGGGKLVIATIASPSRSGYFADYEAAFADLHEGELVELYLDERREGGEDATLALVEDARGIFFTGGDQLRLTSMVSGTALGEWLHRFHREGGLVAGTSAGASAMSATMLVAGESDASGRIGEISMAPGFGLAPEVIIDQHFAERGRIGRLVAALAAAPQVLGLGLDEDTAAVLEDGRFAVIGSGAAYVIDAAGAAHSNIASARSGDPVALHDARLHVLTAGCAFDLAARTALAREAA